MATEEDSTIFKNKKSQGQEHIDLELNIDYDSNYDDRKEHSFYRWEKRSHYITWGSIRMSASSASLYTTTEKKIMAEFSMGNNQIYYEQIEKFTDYVRWRK